MSFEITNSDWYDYGFDAGYHDAVGCCFGSRATGYPDFETKEQADSYNDGYNDGYNSVDD